MTRLGPGEAFPRPAEVNEAFDRLDETTDPKEDLEILDALWTAAYRVGWQECIDYGDDVQEQCCEPHLSGLNESTPAQLARDLDELHEQAHCTGRTQIQIRLCLRCRETGILELVELLRAQK